MESHLGQCDLTLIVYVELQNSLVFVGGAVGHVGAWDLEDRFVFPREFDTFSLDSSVSVVPALDDKIRLRDRLGPVGFGEF